MSKKYSKVHRHKDKQYSKTKTHRKHKREHGLSQNPLEPIEEVSKEKVRVDKNACGDYLHIKSHSKDEKSQKSKRPKDKNDDLDPVNKKNDIKDTKIVENQSNEKLVRHHSLEKPANGLLAKTKWLFRKEKSFNDAVQGCGDTNDKVFKNNDMKKHKHHSRKREENHGDHYNETRAESCDTIDNIYENKDTKKEKLHKHRSKKRNENYDDSYETKVENCDTTDNIYGNKDTTKEKIHKHPSKKREESYGDIYNETRTESFDTNDKIYGNKDTTKEKIHKHRSKKRKDIYGDIYNEARAETFDTNDNIYGNKDTKKEKIHKHHSRKTEEKYGDNYETIRAEIAEKLPEESSVTNADKNLPEILRTKHNKSHKRKHKSKDKSPKLDTPFNIGAHHRVQEVIYCQMNQVPYKMKNDKNSMEVKDLYRRLKRQRRPDKEKKERIKSRSREDDRKKYQLLDETKIFERSIVEDDRKRYNDHNRREKHHRKDEFPPQIVYSDAQETIKHKSKDSSEVTLGPYKKYFAFEKKYHSDRCKKHHKEEHAAKYYEREYSSAREHIKGHPEEDYKSRGRSHEKSDTKKATDEEKIHQLIEGDLKNYFFKIESMIDNKLDAILQGNKREKRRKKEDLEEKRESRQRNRSKSKEKPCEICVEIKKENEVKEKKKKLKSSERKKEENITKEEIINEVLKRLKKEENEKIETEEKIKKHLGKHDDRPTKSQELTDKIYTKIKSMILKSADGKNISEDACISQKKKDLDKSSSEKSSERKNLRGSITVNQISTSHSLQVLEHIGPQESAKSHRHKECNEENRHSKRIEKNKYPEYETRDQTEPFHEKSHHIAKDSLEYIRRRSSPPTELIIPCENMFNGEFKKRYKGPHTYSLSKKQDSRRRMPISELYTASSSCRNFSEQHVNNDIVTPKEKDDAILVTRNRPIYSASEETVQDRYYEEKRSSSPGNYTEKVGITSQHRSRKEEIKPDKKCSPLRKYSNKELDINGIMTDSKDEQFIQRSCRTYLYRSPPRHYFTQNSTQGPEPFLEQIFSPPESFKISSNLINNKQSLDIYPHEFIIQGIEPPILECSRSPARKIKPVRKLECKTVSVLGIPPQIRIKEPPMVSQTQTSNKSNKSSVTERDFVETRKKSKRFKLYYKYSTINNAQDDIGGSSDARSIVSDSHLLVSDPSEEETIAGDTDKAKHIEMCQVVPVNAKNNWNRISTPRDSHLNNIIEEPSNSKVDTCMKNQQYFVPLRGTKDFYRQGFLSSESDCCFRINKKTTNPNKSFQSKDVCVGKQILNEDVIYRYQPFDVKSRSDFKLASKVNGLYVFKSKSDVFLDSSRSKTIKSIFLEDTHPFVRSRNKKQNSNRKSAFENVLKEKDFLITSCKGCQTTEDQTNEVVSAMVEDTKKIMEIKQKQFQEIYKTIDNLEENIQNSRHPPPETVETAVSSMFLTMSCVPKGHIETRAIQTCKDNTTGKIDAAIGSPMGSRQSEIPKRKLSVKQIRDMAVGDSEVKLPPKLKTPRSKSEKPQRKVSKQRTTSVSPIRLMEVSIENRSKSKTPRRKPYMSRLSESNRPKYTREGSCQWSSSSKGTETKNDDHAERIPKETYPKSPVRPRLDSKARTKRTANIPQKSAQCVKVFRSEEKSSNIKKRSSLLIECSAQATNECNAPHSEESSSRGTDKPTYIAPSKPVIQENHVEGATNNSTKEHRPRAKITSKTNQSIEHASCLHHSLPKKSQTPAIEQSTVPTTNTKHLIMNATTYNCQPYVENKTQGLESSTSSSVSEVMSQAIRRSKSLVDFKSNKDDIARSKSEISCSPNTNRYAHIIKDESIITNYMERFTNRPKLRSADSRSHVTSLDRYIGHKFTSRLFLTKDYKGAPISAYQKRKLYDQSIRQKMKKKFRYSKMDVSPQIFEVRFLSMVNQEYNRQNEASDYRVVASYENPPSPKVDRNAYPSDSNNNDNVFKSSDMLSKSEKKLIMGIANTLKVKERDLVFDQFNYNPKNMEIDSNNSKKPSNVISKTRNIVENPEMYPEKLVRFFKKFLDTNNFNEELIKDTSCACIKFSKNCTSCNNFISLINEFYTFLSKYRDSYDTIDPAECDVVKLEAFNTTCQGNGLKRTEELINKNHEFQLNLPQRKSSQPKVENIFSGPYNQISSDSNQSAGSSGPNINNAVDCLSFETVDEANTLTLCQPMSCPVFATNSSSFEFLYEETSSIENNGTPRDVMFANLTKPFDQTINFSTSQYNAEAPFFRRHNFESPTGSIESGYASIKSVGRCTNSLSNFFKKPNIAALLKPILMKKKSELSAIQGSSEQAQLDRDNIYKQMTDSCQLYARKIRQSSETKLAENTNEYQEYSLEFLLGRNGSDVLKSKEMRPIENNIEVSNDNMEQELDENEHDFACMEEQWVEMSSPDSCQEVDLKNRKESQNGFKLILSNDCLRIDSITYLGPDMFTDESKYIGIKNSPSNNDCNQNDANSKHESSITLDFSLDSNNPFNPNNDSTTRNFFTSLIKIYEKEIEICNRLYADDLFEKELLSAVKERKHKKSKKGRFSRFFKKKTPEFYETKANFQEEEASSRLQTHAANARKYFTMLADAVKINENIDNEIKICGLLKLLERIEKGEFQIFENDDHVNLEEEIRSQVTEAFVSIYGLCKVEAKKLKRRLMENEFRLIKSYAIKHRIGLLSTTDIVISYIGRGIIQTEDQLKAAVTYLIRSQAQEINIKEFEEYCIFPK